MTPGVWAGVVPRRWQGEAFAAALSDLRAGHRRILIQAATGTGKARLIAALAAACKGAVLITVPTQALVRQLAETVAEHVGVDRVGRAYQHEWTIDRDVVVTCIPSLPALLAERFSWSCWLADEAHRMEGEFAREARSSLAAQVAIGFTATPFTSTRRGLIHWERISYCYTSYEATQEGVLVPLRVERSDVAGDVDELTAEWVARAEGPGIITATTVADAVAYAERIPNALAVYGYLGRDEIGRRIRALREGQAHALVQVQLLVEGVDIPELCWGALRVPISSPNRLVQFVGRFLRAFPGKREAVLFDPHDCLGSVGLTHAACLEDVQIRAREAEEDPWEIPELPGLEMLAGLPRARAISALEGWATDTLGTLRAAGVAQLPDPEGVNPSGPWRRRPASDKVRNATQRWASSARHLPTDAHRTVVDLLLADPRLRAGTASDVLGILVAFGKRPKAAARVTLPPICALEVA